MFRFLKRWLPARNEIKNPKQTAKQALAMMRREYRGKPFTEEHIDPDPVRQFAAWFEEAVETIKQDPNAMILSTADKNGHPSSRTVLLKGFDENGFVFYTNYNSRKGRHLEENPSVSVTFYWPDLVRQVHIEGEVEKTSVEQSDRYFKTRPEASKLSAWASEQSSSVNSRKELEKRVKEMEKRFEGREIPRPRHWGGYRIKPDRMEFWQGRISRLHDRICYTRKNGKWHIRRLAP